MASFGLATVSELVDKSKNSLFCQNSIYRTIYIYYALYASNLLLVHYVCTNCCCCCLHVCLFIFVLMIAIEFFDE